MPRQGARAGGEEGLIDPAELGSPDLSGEHLHLVPKHDDLDLQFAIRAWTTGADHAAEHRVEDSMAARCYIGDGPHAELEKTYPSRSRKGGSSISTFGRTPSVKARRCKSVNTCGDGWTR